MARQFIPSSPVAPARWPSLVQSVGGEAAVRTFTAANAGEGHANRWEQGVEFISNELCVNPTTALSGVPCATDVFANADTEGAREAENVSDDVLYYWTSSVRSTFCSSEDGAAIARDKLVRQTSHKVEAEFWDGSRHVTLALDGQYLDDGTATAVNAGTAMALPYALAALQDYWARCAGGQRGMIHCTTFTAGLWFTLGAIRRESGLLLDAFDNIIVAGTGYSQAVGDEFATGTAFMTPVVDVHLGEVAPLEAIDQVNNETLDVAFRAGLVKFDPCCKLEVTIDLQGVCG